MQSVDDFINTLLDEKGISDVEPEIREELKEDMKARLMEQINRAAIMQLPEDKATELAEKVDDPEFNDEKMAEFMKESGVDLAGVTLDTMLQFRNFYLDQGE